MQCLAWCLFNSQNPISIEFLKKMKPRDWPTFHDLMFASLWFLPLTSHFFVILSANQISFLQFHMAFTQFQIRLPVFKRPAQADWGCSKFHIERFPLGSADHHWFIYTQLDWGRRVKSYSRSVALAVGDHLCYKESSLKKKKSWCHLN